VSVVAPILQNFTASDLDPLRVFVVSLTSLCTDTGVLSVFEKDCKRDTIDQNCEILQDSHRFSHDLLKNLTICSKISEKNSKKYHHHTSPVFQGRIPTVLIFFCTGSCQLVFSSVICLISLICLWFTFIVCAIQVLVFPFFYYYYFLIIFRFYSG